MNDSLVAGTVSGALTRLFTCPLDVLKIRFQLQLEPIKHVCQQIAIVSMGILVAYVGMMSPYPQHTCTVVTYLQVQRCAGFCENNSEGGRSHCLVVSLQ